MSRGLRLGELGARHRARHIEHQGQVAGNLGLLPDSWWRQQQHEVAVLTHGAVEAAARATSAALGVDPAADRWLACLPLAHVAGLSVVTRAVLTDTPLEVHDGFESGRVAEAATRGATLVSLVAVAVHRAGPQALTGAARRPAEG